jgi:DNA-binding transcriptional LysR family regulator
MRVTLRQIEAFYWTAKLGSIHGAAHHLNVSQPAVSSRIKELESALGMELFSRKNQRVQLTPAGRNALPHAERLLHAAQDFERLGGTVPPLEGVLRLGSDESTAMVALTDILSQLKLRHPKLIVELSIDIGTVLTEKLRRRELDIALHTNSGAASHVRDELLGLGRLPVGRLARAGHPARRVPARHCDAVPHRHQFAAVHAQRPGAQVAAKRRPGIRRRQLLQLAAADAAPGAGRPCDRGAAAAHRARADRQRRPGHPAGAAGDPPTPYYASYLKEAPSPASP